MTPAEIIQRNNLLAREFLANTERLNALLGKPTHPSGPIPGMVIPIEELKPQGASNVFSLRDSLVIRTDTVVSVLSSDTLVLPENPNRTYLFLQSVFTGTISIRAGKAAVAGRGWVLPNQYANINWSWKTEDVPRGEIHAWGSTANELLVVIEGETTPR